jgi:sec-independent protein translocase protein TatC
LALTGREKESAMPDKPAAAPNHSNDENLLRMSFLEHLEELRGRILKCLAGVGVAFVLCTVFSDPLWRVVAQPAIYALRSLGYQQRLVFLTPMDAFITVWVKMPILAAIFLASPWILYQVWAFVAPGLYRRERRWAAPFVILAAGLFIAGGVFAYFVAFRSGLAFLMGIGHNIGIEPMISITEYFDLFLEVTLATGLVFELPVLLFLLILTGIATPAALLRHSRYAVILIAIVAALVTPTTDPFNLTIVSVPMIALYFLGVFAGYLVTRRRVRLSRKALGLSGVLLFGAAGVYLVFGRHVRVNFAPRWPFLTIRAAP